MDYFNKKILNKSFKESYIYSSKKIWLQVFWSFILVFICSCLGLLMLCLVFLMPCDNIRENLKQYASMLEKEGEFPALGFYVNTTLDNQTDSLMLLKAQCNTETNVLDEALNIYSRNSTNDYDDKVFVLKNPAEQKLSPNEVSSYARYWHGYLIILKPLLQIFNGVGIRILNCLLQSILVILFCMLLYHKHYKNIIVPFLISIVILKPYCVGLCLQFSSCYYITIISCFLILLKPEKIKISLLFTLFGALTNYFDLLTYPIITLCFPAILYIAIDWKNQPLTKTFNILIFALFWGIGYFGMWVLKFTFLSIYTHSNAFVEAYNQFLYRSSNESVVWPYHNILPLLAVIVIYGVTVLTPSIILFIFYLVKSIKSIYVLKNNKFFSIENLYNALPYIVIALFPVIWYSFTINHSYTHYGFTHKAAVSSLFAIMVFLSNQSTKVNMLYSKQKIKI